jgi:hypothetical protein
MEQSEYEASMLRPGGQVKNGECLDSQNTYEMQNAGGSIQTP